MTKFDILLSRIQKLPAERQEAVAVQIDHLLDDEEHGSILTDERWAQVETALANKSEPVIPHDEVFARLEAEDE